MVTIQDVERAQKAWGDGIVAISTAHTSGMEYVEIARNLIESLYGYEIGPVLFKPTLAIQEQFRPTFEGALSYFVASNGECIEDKGFAIKNWKKVRFVNDKVILNEKTAIAMGNYFFSSPENDELKVEFTFGYILDSTGSLRINLHHSSMPAVL